MNFYKKLIPLVLCFHYPSLLAISCKSTTLTQYTLTVDTLWTEKDFPKQYPHFRPPAQWSKLFGVIHDSNTTLWRESRVAGNGVSQMAEKGITEILDRELSDGTIKVFNDFRGLPIQKGHGATQAKFFADGNNTKVSLMMKIIPSPDWFIGIDSFELCKDGHWIVHAEINVDLMDAGTENGFTFTSPKWKTQPRNKITRISNNYPNHTANSFYYPELEKLPDIAKVTINQENVFTMIKSRNGTLSTIPYLDRDEIIKLKRRAHIIRRLRQNYARYRNNYLDDSKYNDCFSSANNKSPVISQCEQSKTFKQNGKPNRLGKRRRILCSRLKQNKIMASEKENKNS